MRGGSDNNIYVIPAPSALSFDTATLLAAACCVHAILWLVSMLDKVAEINWQRRRYPESDEEEGVVIPGTNGATKKSMNKVNDMIKMCLGLLVIPIFGGAGLAILIIGERNFFTTQMFYMTEPMAAIGRQTHIWLHTKPFLTTTRSMGSHPWDRFGYYQFSIHWSREG